MGHTPRVLWDNGCDSEYQTLNPVALDKILFMSFPCIDRPFGKRHFDRAIV